jgi:hypothetical protein
MKNKETKTGKYCWNDFLIIISVISNFLARFLTVFFLTNASSISSNVQVLEANPLAQLSSVVNFVAVIWGVVLGAIVLALYLSYRKYRKKDELNSLLFNVFTIGVFLFFFSDFVNDFAVVLGGLLHMG